MRWSLLATTCIASHCLIGAASGQDPLLRPAREMLVDGPARLWDVELADLDGDGDLDLYTDGERFQFVPGAAAPRVHLYDDLGGFRELAGAVDPAVGGEPHSDLSFADFDGDGDMDAYRASWVGGQDQVLLGDGTGKLALAPGGGTASETPWAVALADLDQDGDVDAVSDDSVGGPSFGATFGIRVHVNGGAAAFATFSVPALAQSTGKGGDVAVGDVDSDGLPDVVVATGSYPLLVRNGPGLVFAYASGGIPFDALAHEVELGDLDGDGDLDLVSGTRDWSNPEAEPDLAYRGNGSGGFGHPVVLPGGARVTTALQLDDLDGDGDLDVVLARGDSLFRGTPGQELLRNDGGFAFAQVPAAFESLERWCDDLALGDVDQDGDADLVLAQDDVQTRFLLGDGALGFAEVSTALPWSGADGAVLLADLDGDGDLDGWASIAKGQVQRNPGNGVLVPDPGATAGAVPSKEAGGSFALAFDCNGDGALDVYQARASEFVDDQLYVNNGSGAFTSDHMPFSSETAAAVDVDGDGDADLVLDGGQVLHGDGACGFVWDWFSSLPLAQVASLADIDLDGDLDLVRGFADQPPVWNADVGPGFGPDQPIGVTLDALDLAVSDLDADGDADVLFATAGGPVLLRNDGAGAFTDVTASLPVLATAFWMPRLAAADLDDDGDHDFVMTTSSQWSTAKYFVYANQSGGVFTDGAALVKSDLDDPQGLAAGDVDGDLDVDLVATELSGRLRVLTNHVRQLAWRGLPRAGKDLALDVSGPAGEPWALALSPGQASIPLAPFGLLQLDPAGLKVVASGVLDGAGQAAAVGLMPPGAGSVGLSVYGQAVVGLAPRLTNLEIVTLTAY